MITNKKLWIFGAVVFVLAIALIIIYLPKEERSGKELPKSVVKVGCAIEAMHNFPLFVAKEKGFFDDYGLEVQLKEMDAPLLLPALLAGEIDYFNIVSMGVSAISKGAPLKMVVSLMRDIPYALFSQPGLELKDLKTIGIMYRFIFSHYRLLKLVEEHNLSVKIISPEGILASIPLLQRQEVDALFYPYPTLSAIKLEKEGYPILLIENTGVPQALGTTEDKIKNNPEEIEKMIKALQASAEFIRNNPKESKELLYDFLRLEKTDTNQEIIEKIYPILRELVEVSSPTEEGMKLLIKHSKAGEYSTYEEVDQQAVSEEEINKFFDLRFVK